MNASPGRRELIELAQSGQVVGNGAKQIKALVDHLSVREFHLEQIWKIAADKTLRRKSVEICRLCELGLRMPLT